MERLRAEAVLRCQGLNVKFGKEDGNDFYRRISLDLYGTDKHPNRARKEICNFEKSVPYVDYFQLFVTKSGDSKAPRKETFYNEIKCQIQRKKAPCLREVRATAEKLRKEIYVFSRMDDSAEWKWFLFSPILPSEMNLNTECLAFLRYEIEDEIEFATVEEKYLNRYNLRSTITEIMSMANISVNESNSRRYCTESDTADVVSHDGVEHLYYCHKNHFCNWFTASKSEILYHENVFDFSEDDTENLSTENTNFFKCLSKELYGSEKHNEFLSGICSRHTEISDKSIFKRILNVFEKPDKEDQKPLINCPENVSTNPVLDKVINEVASTFNVTICITNSISKPVWEIYVPANEMWSFDSSILLLRTGGKYFRLRRKGELFLLCEDVELRPKDLDIQKNHVKSSIDIKVQGAASSNRRNSIISSDYRHDGLFTHIAEDFPIRIALAEKRNVKEYHPFSEFSHVLKRKDMNGRSIDHVTLDSQSFYRCISKEVFGSENFHNYLRNKVNAVMKECMPMTRPEEPDKTQSTKFNFMFTHLLMLHGAFLPLTVEKESHKAQDVVSSKEATDDEIMVASYLFKTPIYVLCCYSDGSNQWIEYNHISIQPDDVEKYYRGHCKLDGKARGHYITLLRSSCGHYNRIVPSKKVCNCLMVSVNTSQPEDKSLVKMNKRESDMVRMTQYVEKHASIIEIAMNDWNTIYNLLSEKCHRELGKLSNKTKKLDVLDMISASSGFAGIALILIGVVATPITFGTSLALGVTGSVLSGSSSVAACISYLFGLDIKDKARSQLKRYEQELRKYTENYGKKVANSHQAITELNCEIKSLFSNRTDDDETKPCHYTVIVPAAMKTSMSVQLPLVSVELGNKH